MPGRKKGKRTNRDNSPKSKRTKSQSSSDSSSYSSSSPYSSSDGEMIPMQELSLREKMPRFDDFSWMADISPDNLIALQSAIKNELTMRNVAKKESDPNPNPNPTPHKYRDQEVEDITRVRLRRVIPKSPLTDHDIIAYKSVRLQMAGSNLSDISVLLRLRIPFSKATIYDIHSSSSKPKIATHSSLKGSKKYATNLAYVDGVQFFSKTPLLVKKAMLAFQTGNAKLISLHDSQFEYRLQQYVTEPRAGDGCGSGRCGSGIYFYLGKGEVVGNGYLTVGKDFFVSNVIGRSLLFEDDPNEDAVLEEASQHRAAAIYQWKSLKDIQTVFEKSEIEMVT